MFVHHRLPWLKRGPPASADEQVVIFLVPLQEGLGIRTRRHHLVFLLAGETQRDAGQLTGNAAAGDRLGHFGVGDDHAPALDLVIEHRQLSSDTGGEAMAGQVVFDLVGQTGGRDRSHGTVSCGDCVDGAQPGAMIA
ncbi:hypothetical protein G6F66_015243 [Rhizopus arrhizus]|nr:hypothetical protein G6F66_015243 [Rhizopus arrhizus]